MPRGQPFTQLCQLAAQGRHAGRADLHIHTMASDGSYTPRQVIDVARSLGLSAVAITDHDTTAGIAEARQAARGTTVEVLAGAEITTEHRGKEVHLLAYCFHPDEPALAAAFDDMCRQRTKRFHETLHRLRIQDMVNGATAPNAWGRRHLAELLVRAGKAANLRDAFRRYLHDSSPLVAPKLRLPVKQALKLVRGAGGVAAWAHPPYDATVADFAELRGLGLRAIEVECPTIRQARRRELRSWAGALGLAITGGSDSHGPGRPIGTRTISAEEVSHLRRIA
jgi:predicted metal-dependent phosphoesterase TrpH